MLSWMTANSSQYITRKKTGKNFQYFRGSSRVVKKEELERLRGLAVPPAWKNVRINASSKAKILAEGRDGAGRKQAIYNPAYRKMQERKKYMHMVKFGRALPKLRKQIEKDIQKKKLSKEKVLACVVKLIDTAYFRVGNEQYAKQNSSYGVTTLRSKHIDVDGYTVTFSYTGKSKQKQEKKISDRTLALVIKQLDEMPGQELFQYQDNKGELHKITSADVNDYIRRHMGEQYSAKDFRTWGGTLLAVGILVTEEPQDEKEKKKCVTKCVTKVAARLGNTPAVARSSYIDPRVIEAFIDGNNYTKLKRAMKKIRAQQHMSKEERCVLELLES
jgi:DNA topoisomerase I